jgi:hypothetical protein
MVQSRILLIFIFLLINNKLIEAGTLTVISEPSLAFVYLDDKLIGLTPLVVGGIKPGMYKIKINKSGFLPDEQEIIHRGGEYKHLVILSTRLKKLPELTPFTLEYPNSFILSKNQLYLRLTKEKGALLCLGLPYQTNLFLYQYGIGINYRIIKLISLNFSFDFKDKSKIINLIKTFNFEAFHSMAHISCGIRYNNSNNNSEWLSYLSLQTYILRYLDFLLEVSKEKKRIGFLFKFNKKNFDIIIKLLPNIDIGVGIFSPRR